MGRVNFKRWTRDFFLLLTNALFSNYREKETGLFFLLEQKKKCFNYINQYILRFADLQDYIRYKNNI